MKSEEVKPLFRQRQAALLERREALEKSDTNLFTVPRARRKRPGLQREVALIVAELAWITNALASG